MRAGKGCRIMHKLLLPRARLDAAGDEGKMLPCRLVPHIADRIPPACLAHRRALERAPDIG